MQIILTWQSVITAGAVIGALGAIITAFVKIVRWTDKQSIQAQEIVSLRETHNHDVSGMKTEQTLIIYGLLACLKGLKEQGCNGPVTEAISKIEKHLNQQAHK